MAAESYEKAEGEELYWQTAEDALHISPDNVNQEGTSR